MRLATWNVNSIRARLERLLELLAAHAPDVLALQETKVDPETFPHGELAAVGYRAADLSGGRWCGVALVVPSAATIDAVRGGLDGEPDPTQARWIEGTVNGLRIVSTYVPNGQTVGSEPFAQKLVFFAVAAKRLEQLAQRPEPIVVMGDMNVAPTDLDVWDVTAFADSTHVTPHERDGHAAMARAGGLIDAYHHLHPELGPEAHTWWDYRAGNYHKRKGMRIDHVLVSEVLAGSVERATVDRAFRKGAKPSDHAPVVVDLAR